MSGGYIVRNVSSKNGVNHRDENEETNGENDNVAGIVKHECSSYCELRREKCQCHHQILNLKSMVDEKEKQLLEKESVIQHLKDLLQQAQSSTVKKDPESADTAVQPVEPLQQNTPSSSSRSKTASGSSHDMLPSEEEGHIDEDSEYKPDESDKERGSSLSEDDEIYNRSVRTTNADNTDMVAIGTGHTLVPSRLLKQLDWNSYTYATRKLLTALFPRRVLATHSLTGKPSPAFPDKPAKKRLNSRVVNDIVQVVSTNCRVPESVVRTSITTKCADESKMLRSRETKNKRLSKKENLPQRSSSSSSR